MKKKFRRRPWKDLPPKPPTIKRRKLSIDPRPQLLSADSLVDVFSWSKRSHMDQWHTISHNFNVAALNAKPLRSVEDVKFAYDADKKAYSIMFTRSQLKFKSNAKKRTWQVTGLQRDAVDEALDVFFSALRYTSISESLRFRGIEITGAFVNRMKEVSKCFALQKPRLLGSQYFELNNVTLADEVNPFEMIAAFPGMKRVPRDACRLLREKVGVNDRLLTGLAAHSFWETETIWGMNDTQPNEITEQGILDYLFRGSLASSGEQPRKLRLYGASLSPEFLHKIVQARRACSDAHKVYLSVESKQTMEIGDLAVHGRMSTSMGIPIDHWTFTFPDIPKFSIAYRVPKPYYVDPFGIQRDFGGGYGQIECWSNYDNTSDVWREE